MSISCEILGGPGNDNALLVRLDSGQGIARLLFDCGEDCLSFVPFGEILEFDHVLFSHLHMDHVCGFDTLFRSLYNRMHKPNHIWGPPETARILQHRMQGYCWNLHESMAATWNITDVHPSHMQTTRLELQEAFAKAHPAGTERCDGKIIDAPNYTVETITMDHRTPVLAFVVRERTRQNVNVSRLASLGPPPGPWLQLVKSGATTREKVMIAGKEHFLADLRAALLEETPGDSVAYLTDFLLDETAMNRLIPFLHGCHTIVCEAQYGAADADLAQRHHHMTTPRWVNWRGVPERNA